MEYYILIPSVLVSLLVGALVVMRTIHEARYQVYALLTFLFIIIAIANTLSLDTSLPQLFYVRVVMATTSLGLYLLYLLICTVRSSSQSWHELFGSAKWLGLLTLGVVVLDLTPLVFSSVVAGKPPIPVPGVGAAIYILHYAIVSGASLWRLYKGLTDKSNSLSVRHQYRLILIGLLPIVLLAPITGFVLLLVFHMGQFVILTPVYTLFFVCCVGYAMARHGLFDVRLAAVRTLVYALSVFVMAMMYFGIAYMASVTIFRDGVASGIGMSPLNIAVAVLLAFVFQPVKQFFDRVTNRIFYRDRYDTSEFIARLGRTLTDTTHLHEVLERAGDEIATTLKANGYMFLVYVEHHNDVVVGSKLKNHLTEEERESLRGLAELTNDGVFTVGDARGYHNQQVRHIRSILAKRRVALALPLVTTTETVGYLLLGEQLSSGYVKRDVRVLEAIADELVIAIQNARSVKIVRDLNEHLEQRVQAATRELRASNKQLLEMDATKDEFVSMASHQLRTPLTSVKGYLSMVLDGDAGEISQTQRQLLGEAFTSSERMVHLIGDFLNVSRLQTGKFIIDPHACDLSKVTEQEVEGMQQIAQAHGLKIVYKKPKRFPTLYIDEGKIRQVIMNFMDNAIYYSPETASITVSMAVEDGDAVFRVTDKGMGVPKDVQKKLFTKFFRAENARTQRPDGTGIGLYLAKKVIDGHGGKLVFESTLGKGSTFGFRLPIKKLSSPPVIEPEEVPATSSPSR